METVQQHLRILQEDDSETARVVRLAATIGLRRNEIAGLRWEHVDLDKGLVSMRAVPFSPMINVILNLDRRSESSRNELS